MIDTATTSQAQSVKIVVCKSMLKGNRQQITDNRQQITDNRQQITDNRQQIKTIQVDNSS